jgi:hypothetical protein
MRGLRQRTAPSPPSAGRAAIVDDLFSLDPELYRNLNWMKRCNDEQLRALELDFTASHNAYGRSQTVELIRGGAHVPVTSANAIRYVHLMAHYLLSARIRTQSAAFQRGLAYLIDVRWLRMFARDELQLLISGDRGSIDIDDWQRHTALLQFGPAHECVQWFFEVLRESAVDMQVCCLVCCPIDHAHAHTRVRAL